MANDLMDNRDLRWALTIIHCSFSISHWCVCGEPGHRRGHRDGDLARPILCLVILAQGREILGATAVLIWWHCTGGSTWTAAGWLEMSEPGFPEAGLFVRC
jgi:hypothetical protein